MRKVSTHRILDEEDDPSLQSWEQAGEESLGFELDRHSNGTSIQDVSQEASHKSDSCSQSVCQQHFEELDEIFAAPTLTSPSLERAWAFLEPKEIKMPWEQGVWSSVFGVDKRFDFQSNRFERPDVFPLWHEEETSGTNEKISNNKILNGWKFLVSNEDTQSWKEMHEARLETAIKRWHDVIDGMSDEFLVVQQFKALTSISSRLRMVKDVLSSRSPLTLLKRVNALQNYIGYLDNKGQKFPADETTLYLFMCEQRDTGAPRSRLQSLVESLRFMTYVLGLENLAELLLSKRCIGAAAKIQQGPQRQASPLLVTELMALHRCLDDCGADSWDRLFCGAALFGIYSRSRWNDLQHAEHMEPDICFGMPVYLEAKVIDHKTKRSNTWSGGVLTAVAPAYGVAQTNWVTSWIEVRTDLFGAFDLEFPVMPAPDCHGEPTRRPLSTKEVRLWLNMVLDRAGLESGCRRRTSHSFKVTMLSFLAKYGASINDRELLGGHSSHLKSVLTYSRDSLAGPIRTLEQLLDAIRKGDFSPDQSRSGRFLKRVKLEENQNSQPLSEATSQVETVDSDSSESDASGTTSSDSQEDEATSSKSARLVKSPHAPDGTRLIRHAKSKCVHLMKLEADSVLLCGRVINDHYESVVASLMRWDTPLCGRCWKNSKS